MTFPNEADHRRVKYLMDHDEKLSELVGLFLWANSRLMAYSAHKYGEELGDQICCCAAVQTAYVLEDLGYKTSEDLGYDFGEGEE